ncbi:MAG TPA: ATP-binding cassette domain-containing protein [Candidatus Binataceae bacterium]|nr:ATP-binding cassette domain-containing protein [Candidatus Binataceae bacterium]
MESANHDSAAIVVEELRRRFDHQQVLDGVNLACPSDHITTIVGPSGCGKTVLLKHLNLLLRPDSGRIIIDGSDATAANARGIDRIREKFGMLFQAGALFDSMSVFDNVAFPLVEKTHLSRAEIRDRVLEMLEQVGLKGMEHKYPSEMSGGMQKRAALARALVHRPKILMLDEPTTGLDPARSHSVHELIRATQQKFKLSVVMVSHDVPQVFQISDRVAYMHAGKIALFGSVAEVTAADHHDFQQFLAGKAAGEDERPLSQVIATPGR